MPQDPELDAHFVDCVPTGPDGPSPLSPVSGPSTRDLLQSILSGEWLIPGEGHPVDRPEANVLLLDRLLEGDAATASTAGSRDLARPHDLSDNDLQYMRQILSRNLDHLRAEALARSEEASHVEQRLVALLAEPMGQPASGPPVAGSPGPGPSPADAPGPLQNLVNAASAYDGIRREMLGVQQTIHDFARSAGDRQSYLARMGQLLRMASDQQDSLRLATRQSSADADQFALPESVRLLPELVRQARTESGRLAKLSLFSAGGPQPLDFAADTLTRTPVSDVQHRIYELDDAALRAIRTAAQLAERFPASALAQRTHAETANEAALLALDVLRRLDSSRMPGLVRLPEYYRSAGTPVTVAAATGHGGGDLPPSADACLLGHARCPSAIFRLALPANLNVRTIGAGFDLVPASEWPCHCATHLPARPGASASGAPAPAPDPEDIYASLLRLAYTSMDQPSAGPGAGRVAGTDAPWPGISPLGHLASVASAAQLTSSIRSVEILRGLGLPAAGASLRLAFLRARSSAFIEILGRLSISASLRAHLRQDQTETIKKIFEVFREMLQTVTSQYSAVFFHEEDHPTKTEDGPPTGLTLSKQLANQSVLSTWTANVFDELANMLSSYISNTTLSGSTLSSLFHQTTELGCYAGQRLGFDSRFMLTGPFHVAFAASADLMLSRIVAAFDTAVQTSNRGLLLHPLPAAEMQQLLAEPSAFVAARAGPATRLRPPGFLVSLPPMGMLVNSIVTCLNEHRSYPWAMIGPNTRGILDAYWAMLRRCLALLVTAAPVAVGDSDMAHITRGSRPAASSATSSPGASSSDTLHPSASTDAGLAGTGPDPTLAGTGDTAPSSSHPSPGLPQSKPSHTADALPLVGTSLVLSLRTRWTGLVGAFWNHLVPFVVLATLQTYGLLAVPAERPPGDDSDITPAATANAGDLPLDPGSFVDLLLSGSGLAASARAPSLVLKVADDLRAMFAEAEAILLAPGP